MSIARKCDRCGALVDSEVKNYPNPLIKIVDEFSATNQRAFMELDDLDLCTTCKKSFFNWLDEGKRKQDVDDGYQYQFENICYKYNYCLEEFNPEDYFQTTMLFVQLCNMGATSKELELVAKYLERRTTDGKNNK